VPLSRIGPRSDGDSKMISNGVTRRSFLFTSSAAVATVLTPIPYQGLWTPTLAKPAGWSSVRAAHLLAQLQHETDFLEARFLTSKKLELTFAAYLTPLKTTNDN